MLPRGPHLKQLFDLTGRTAMVTGGAQNLGLDMAEALAEAGANLVITSRLQEKAEAAAEGLRSYLPVAILPLGLDVSDEGSVQSAFARVRDEFGRLDVLVCNAGGARLTGECCTTERMSVDDWDYVVVTASSSQASKYHRTDTGLWHVVDGVIDTEDRYHSLTWQDDTPDQFPDWLEIKLPQAQSLGRLEVHPFQQSLRDYEVQALVDGQWREVAKVTGQTTDHITHTFAPVTTDRVRLLVTAANGKNSMVAEVEAYAN